ncbi:MAG: hypothetical protein LBT92_03545 [Rickettsiales bacterium]|jgi:hypothetical protein|nr:hypothetical protein [Rickettsiales bacterium]
MVKIILAIGLAGLFLASGEASSQIAVAPLDRANSYAIDRPGKISAAGELAQKYDNYRAAMGELGRSSANETIEEIRILCERLQPLLLENLKEEEERQALNRLGCQTDRYPLVYQTLRSALLRFGPLFDCKANFTPQCCPRSGPGCSYCLASKKYSIYYTYTPGYGVGIVRPEWADPYEKTIDPYPKLHDEIQVCFAEAGWPALAGDECVLLKADGSRLAESCDEYQEIYVFLPICRDDSSLRKNGLLSPKQQQKCNEIREDRHD